MKLGTTQTQQVLSGITAPVMKSDIIPGLHKGAFIKTLFDHTIHTLMTSKHTIPDLEVYVHNQTQKAIEEYKRLSKSLPCLQKDNLVSTINNRKTEIGQLVAKSLMGQNIRQKRIEQYSHSNPKSR